MGLTYEQAKRLGIEHLWPTRAGADAPGPGPRAAPSERPASASDGMNKTETAYSRTLECLRIDGRILRWDFEPVKLRLAGRTFYTPDFRVILIDGSTEMHEVKGHMRDDASVKIKVAACIHPYVFRLIYRVKGGWEWHVVGRGGIGPAGRWEP